MIQQNTPYDLSRPSSVSSSHSSTCYSNSSKKNRGKSDICVGEELKIAVDIALERFRLSEEQKQLEFPSSLTSLERAYIHQLGASLGFKTKSKGHGSNRVLTVSKKEDISTSPGVSVLDLMRNSRHQIHSLVQRFPVTNREKQDLLPRTERGHHTDSVAKDMSKATTGRLNNGVPQVPPALTASDLKSFTQTLPIMKHADTIRKMISENQVIMVSGETGSGKTTQIPQMILEDCHEQNRACRIFCTQPRRIAALSVAERVAAERGEKVGQTVGYQIRLESRVSPRTVLTFCTNGVLLRTLMGSDNAMSNVTHILVDEIHERDRFSDFLLIALRDAIPKNVNLKIILMSAALNTQLFCNYFGGCPVVNVPGNLFDVQCFFLEDILKLSGFMNEEMKKYKTIQSSVNEQTEKLDEWYAQQSQEAEEEDDEVVVEGDEVISLHNSEGFSDDGDVIIPSDNTGSEKDEVEEWLREQLDELLSEAWMTGKDECLHKLIQIVMSENVCIDYMHSETSATALMVAAGRGFFSLVELLLQLGASVSLLSSNDWSALDWAHHFHHADIVELLEAHIASSELVQSNETMLVQQADDLSDELKQLLHVYHHSCTEVKVNLELILCLLHQIHSSSKEGAVLVFLPGYDDIVALRDLILSDKRFLDSNRYTIYTLHSQVQTSDQRKVFKLPPPGVRKIILATNIAETSITINDVVFVIDSGKVKVKSFDAITSASSLKEQWISQASALQRRGRAGRCQGGVCYRLFSSVRYNSMSKFQEPELLRHPLQELCLHAKLLTPVNCRIADYLAKAPEPPAFLLTRNAVHILKQMDALDSFEDLTELGLHLADLPIEPKYGKMILYSVVLKCLDPILTISCSLAYKDPFLLPAQAAMKRGAMRARRKFSADTYSDHMALLRAFQAWQKAKTEGWEKSFCEQNYLSSATMEMIVGMRTQLLGQLRASGFVRARGGGDIRDLNTNSENWAVVKAALTAGLYPNLIKVDRVKRTLSTVKENNVRFHATTTVGPDATTAKSLKKFIGRLPSDWLVYEEMTRLHRVAQVKCCTLVSPVTVALFAGAAKLPLALVKEAESSPLHAGLGCMPQHHLVDGDSSDSETENKEETRSSTYRPDDWIHFTPDTETSSLLMQLRQKWHSLFLRRMRAPAKCWSQMDEALIRTVVQVLTNEEQGLGLQQPAGIGQRPRPMSAESCISSGGSRRGSYDTEHSDDSSASGEIQRYNTPRHQAPRPFKVQTTPPKRRDVIRGDGERNDSSSTPSSGSASAASGSGANSLRGSATSSPCTSPLSLTSSPDPVSSTSEGSKPCDGGPGSSYYVVMKATNHRLLDISQQKSLWAASSANEKKLNKAFLDGRTVLLVFSVQGSGHFQGYAQMTSPSGQAERMKEFSGPGMGATFSVQWLKRANLPFQQCHHLLNPWNENKKVQVSRDGQELEPSVGLALTKLWDNVQQFQPRNPSSSSQYRPGLAVGGIVRPPADMMRRGGPAGDWRSSGQWGGQPQYPGGFQHKNFGPHSPGMGRPLGNTSPYNSLYLSQQMIGSGGQYMSPKGSPQANYTSHHDAQSVSPVMILQRGGNHDNASPTPASLAATTGSQPGSYYSQNTKN